MVRYVFGQDDVLRTRFAVSPLFEATASVAALRDPAGHSLHLPWIREARERLGGADHAMLDALVSDRGRYTPDFIAPPPESPLPDVHAEIERVGRTPAAQVRRELASLVEGGPVAPALRPLLEEPRRGLRRLVEQLRRYWALAIEPFWDRIQATLEDDIAHRARLLTAGGPIEVFADLHPKAHWEAGALVVDREFDADVELDGRGLQLVPSVFIWPAAGTLVDPPWQPALIYPPRGVGLLWQPQRHDDGALAELLGVRRARILDLLDREASTTALARRLGASAAGVSEHLGVLRRAGLVRGRRDGRTVLYARTAAGDALLRGAGAGSGG